MDSVLKKIFSGITDEKVHEEFIKFGKGTFQDRYLVEAKKQKDKFSIKTSAEFSNYLVRSCLEKLSGPVKINGIILSTFDLSKEISFPIEKVKKYMGIQQAIINAEINPQDILQLMDKFPKVHFGLSFKTPVSELKIKPKAPKSGKPGKKGEEDPKADFCSIKTSDKEIIENLFFDIPEFKEIRISHTLQIDEIIIPSGIENQKELREKSIRKGKIIRKIKVDGSEKMEEKSFEA